MTNLLRFFISRQPTKCKSSGGDNEDGDNDDDDFDDHKGEEEAEERGKVTESKESPLEDEKTPIQKLVEERFSRQAEVKTESPPQVELENQEPLGMKKNSSSQVTEGIDFLLGKAFPVSEMSSGGVKESLVTGGLRHIIERGTKDK